MLYKYHIAPVCQVWPRCHPSHPAMRAELCRLMSMRAEPPSAFDMTKRVHLINETFGALSLEIPLTEIVFRASQYDPQLLK
ncbi:hypothetical protein Mapa_013420 [Marchantia paleacea]|nr:hypothetical protein Mapa_013420 [Marchantia paleacea]